MAVARPPSSLSPAGALLALHASVALFGFAGLFGKWIAWDPAAIVLGRTVVAAAVLAFVVRWRDGAIGLPDAGVAANGVVLAVHWCAFFAAIQASTVAIGLLGYASFPLFVPLLERALLGVPLRPRALVDMALVTLGLVLLVPEFSWASRTAHGLAWGLLSGFTFALLTVRTRRMRATQGAARIALWQNAVAAVCVVPFVLATGASPAALDGRTLGLVAVLGVACTALAHTLFAASLGRVAAATAAMVAALEPVYGIALAALLLHEVPDLPTLAGAGLLVAAAVIASQRTQGPVPSPS
jgi:drug/metabolite transporter (DMT)-like permease